MNLIFPEGRRLLMELTGKITAKIHAHTFDGVPEDTEVTIFIPGVKVPIKATLSDVEIEKAAEAAVEELKPAMTFQQMFLGQSIGFGGGGGGGDGGTIVYNGMALPMWAPKPEGPKVNGHDAVQTLKAAIPGLEDARSTCPACGKDGHPEVFLNMWDGSTNPSWAVTEAPLIDVIVHLNDHHKWSREAVADWLETLDADLQFVAPGKE